MAEQLADIFQQLVDDRAAVGFRAFDGSRRRARACRRLDRDPPSAGAPLHRDGAERTRHRCAPTSQAIWTSRATSTRRCASSRRTTSTAVRTIDLFAHSGAGCSDRCRSRRRRCPRPWRRGLRRHTRRRDARAISHHYDVSNRFYELLLGPSMTYSCAVFPSHDATLEEAQREKIDLICRKLDLQAGERLLDVGAGWGGARTPRRRALRRPCARRDALATAGRLRDAARSPTPASKVVPKCASSTIATWTPRRSTPWRRSARWSTSARRRCAPLRSDGGAPATRGADVESRHLAPQHQAGQRGPVRSSTATSSPTASSRPSARSSPRCTTGAWRSATRRTCASTTRSRSANGRRTSSASWHEAVAEVGEHRARVWRLYLATVAHRLRNQPHPDPPGARRARRRPRQLGNAAAPDLGAGRRVGTRKRRFRKASEGPPAELDRVGDAATADSR